MLKITITDTETGKVITREGKFVFLHTAEAQGAGTVTLGSGKFGAVDVVRCMIAHDYIKQQIFEYSPVTKALYDARGMFFRQGAVVDWAELERQMKGGGSE